MRTLTTQQHYEVPGGTLKVILEIDHPLRAEERERLEVVAAACAAFGAGERFRRVAPAEAARELDAAIWALGGEAGISAG